MQTKSGMNHYRPHPKDGEGTVFTGVCLSTLGGGSTPDPGYFPGPFWGYPSPRFVPKSFLGGGTPNQDWGTPSATPAETGAPLPPR